MTTSFLNVHKRENFVGYRSCDNNPIAAAVAVMISGVLPWQGWQGGIKETKNNILQISSDTRPVITATVAAVGVSSHGL
jgi:hypothetical protein